MPRWLDGFAWFADLVNNVWGLYVLISCIAIWVATRWGWRKCSERTLKDLLGQLGNLNATDREEAKRQLTACGRKAVPLITSVLQEASDNELKKMAVEILCDIGTPALRELLATRRYDDVAPYVDDALQGHLPRVVGSRQHKNGHVLLWRRLMKRDTGSEDIVEGLIPFLDDPDPIIQQGAALALGQYPRPDIAKVLGQRLYRTECRNQEVRETIATSLGDTKQAEAIHFLDIALKDPSRDVRMAACYALSKLKQAEAIPSLQEVLLPLEDHGVMMEAAKALGNIGGPPAQKILEDALKHFPNHENHRELREVIGSQYQKSQREGRIEEEHNASP